MTLITAWSKVTKFLDYPLVLSSACCLANQEPESFSLNQRMPEKKQFKKMNLVTSSLGTERLAFLEFLLVMNMIASSF